MNIGLIGLGLLGSALADRLQASGFSIAGYDVKPDRRTVASLQAVAAASQRIVLSLPDSNIVATVVSELEPFLTEGAILIDTTTGDPERTSELGLRLETGGIQSLDADIGGSSKELRAGWGSLLC